MKILTKRQKEFIKGKIAYETVITDFSDNDNKITTRLLLNDEIYNQFNQALKDRTSRGHLQKLLY